MVDTHAHLALCDAEPSEVVSSASRAGVERILTVGLDEASSAQAADLAEALDGVYASAGRHPNEASGFDEAAAAALRAVCERPSVVAVGETGLDLYRDSAPLADQRRAFSSQIAIGRELGLPIVCHLRDRDGGSEAISEAFATLESEADSTPCVLHCFSGDAGWAERAAGNGWFCSFAGNLTYPSADGLRAAAKAVPDHLVLVETDAPFLSPQSVRGTRNEPANVVETAQCLAELRGVAYDELEATVAANAERLFGW